MYPIAAQEGPASRNKNGSQLPPPPTRSKKTGGAHMGTRVQLYRSDRRWPPPLSTYFSLHCQSPLGNPTHSTCYTKISLHSYGYLQQKRGHLKRNFSTWGKMSNKDRVRKEGDSLVTLMHNCVHIGITTSKLFIATCQSEKHVISR